MVQLLHGLDAEAAVAFLSAVIAALAAAMSFWFARKSAMRAEVDQEIAKIRLRDDYYRRFLDWADETAKVLTEAIHLCDLDPSKVTGESFFDRRHRLLISLSTMIDRGRWFHPNIEIDDHGMEKEPGYRGTGMKYLMDSCTRTERCALLTIETRRITNR
jgi:hypothetical protein